MKYAFFYHYNKPASKKCGIPMISLHYRDRCLLVKNIVINVPTRGRINKRQPHFVVTGRAESVSIRDDIAYID